MLSASMPPRKGRSTTEPPKRQPSLAVSRAQAESQIDEQITKGEALKALDPHTVRNDLEWQEKERVAERWRDYVIHMLERLFDNDLPAQAFAEAWSQGIIFGSDHFEYDNRYYDRVSGHLSELQSIRDQLPLYPEPRVGPQPLSQPAATVADDVSELLQRLYIYEKAREQDTEHGRPGTFNSASVAEKLEWAPSRLNRAMELLAQGGLAELEPGLGARPFISKGIQLTARGMLSAEKRSTPKAEIATNQKAGDPRNVFVIHGRNSACRDAIFSLLRSVNL